MATLTPSGLSTIAAYNTATWASTTNTNLVRLNSTLLKLSGLLDVDATGLVAGQILVYSTAAGKFIPYTPPARRKRVV